MHLIFNHDLIKVPSLDGSGKMSKSENEMATIFLSDEDEAIRKKIMKARTDTGPTENNSVKPDYIDNLFLLMKLVSSKETLDYFEEKFNNCSIRYGDMKKTACRRYGEIYFAYQAKNKCHFER